MGWLPGSQTQRNRAAAENPTLLDLYGKVVLGTTHLAAQASTLSTLNAQMIGLSAQLDQINAALGDLADGLKALAVRRHRDG